MMPVVRISDDNWARLKQHARPLEDTVDDVIGAALDALDQARGVSRPKQRTGSAKKVRGPKLPQKEFRKPILEALITLGGSANTRDIREMLLPLIEARLGPADRALVTSGDPRWWNAACWERNEMVKDGLLKSNSPRGVWELTAYGRDYPSTN